MGVTPTIALPYPEPPDPPDIPADMHELALAIDALADTSNGFATLDSGGKVPLAQLLAAVANGLATLDATGKVPAAQLPAIGGAPTYGPSPPPTPADGAEWILPISLPSGGPIVWRFRYNAGSASAYKWEYVGGAPYIGLITLGETTTTVGSFVDTATAGPGLSMPRAGEYVFVGSAVSYSGAGPSQTRIALAINGVIGGVEGHAWVPAAGQNNTATMQTQRTVAAAGHLAKLQVNVGNSGNGWSNRALSVTPIRVA
jgi:hypothetical protein